MDAVALVLAAVEQPVQTAPLVLDLVGPEPLSFARFLDRLARAARALGRPADYQVAQVPIEDADEEAAAGGYRGMLPDELDCFLCDEVADHAPLEALLGPLPHPARRVAPGRGPRPRDRLLARERRRPGHEARPLRIRGLRPLPSRPPQVRPAPRPHLQGRLGDRGRPLEGHDRGLRRPARPGPRGIAGVRPPELERRPRLPFGREHLRAAARPAREAADLPLHDPGLGRPRGSSPSSRLG
jgi:hypothetical protein